MSKEELEQIHEAFRSAMFSSEVQFALTRELDLRLPGNDLVWKSNELYPRVLSQDGSMLVRWVLQSVLEKTTEDEDEGETDGNS